MKLKLTKLIASTVALAVISASAIAQEGNEKKGKKKGKAKPAAERPEGAGKGGQRGARAERSPEEIFKSIKQRLADNEKFAEMFAKRADSNEDGKVSEDTRQSVNSCIAEEKDLTKMLVKTLKFVGKL